MTIESAPIAAQTDLEILKQEAKATLEPMESMESMETETAETTELAQDDTEEMTMDQVADLIEAGTTAFALANYELATEKLSMAVEIKTKHFGPQAQECADTLYLYGKALLANGVAKSAILNEKPEQVEVSAEEAVEAAGKDGSRFVFGDETTQGEQDVEEPEETCALDEIETGDDEADDIELAWENLDLARLIYSKSTESEDQQKLGDVHLALGDVSLESENFEQAIEDFKTALDIKAKFLEPTHRELAEAHYKLAMALEYSERTEDAIEQVKLTMDVVTARMEYLKTRDHVASDKGKETPSVEMSEETKKELADMETLFPDMQAKLDELLMVLEKEADGEAIGMTEENSVEPATVHDVSSLVKKSVDVDDKKRKAEDVDELAKKTKTDA